MACLLGLAACGGDSTRTLTVEKLGNGSESSRVTSTPSGIECGAVCEASFPSAAKVTLRAVPATDYVFEGWSGGGCSGTDPCTLTLERDLTVRARFGDRPAELTLKKAGSGLGAVTGNGLDCGESEDECQASYPAGEAVTLSAQAAEGSSFMGWEVSGGGQSCDGLGECSLEMIADITVTARFDEVPEGQVSLSVTRTGEGTVTSDPPGIDCPDGLCTAFFSEGATVTLTAEAAEGWSFAEWDGCNDTMGTNCTVILKSDRTVSATFSTNGSVESVTISPKDPPQLTIGETLQFTATVEASGGASTEVTWSSSQPRVATVSSSGLVTAQGEGATTITATSVFDPSKSDSVQVTVAALPAGLRIAPTVTTCGNVNVGQTCTVTIAMDENTLSWDGFEFDFAMDRFTLEKADRGSLLDGNCLVAAGPSKVMGVCEDAFEGSGSLVVLTLERLQSGPTSAQVTNAYLARDGSTKTSIEGGTLSIP